MQPTHNTVTNSEVAYEPVTPASVLRAAGGYLHHFGWHQDDLFNDPDQPTPAACPLGAIRMAVIGTPEVRAEHNRTGVLAAFDRAVGVFADHLVNTYGVDPVGGVTAACAGVVFTGDLEQTVIRWNDHPDRIASHVIAALNGAADEWDRIHPATAEDTASQREPAHADYPHHPGTLYDCPACEAECFCNPGYGCVHCAIEADTAELDEDLPECCPHKRPIGACECDAATELAELKAETLAAILGGAK